MPYRSQRLVVFANREHALARCGEIVLKDLQSQRFVIREEGSTTRRVFESELIARNINIQVALEMGSREAVREAVAQGISEEHTSELQSPCNLVCRLLLEKKTSIT